MLKNKVFSASIFGGIGLRFGRVFGKFVRSKMHANSKTKKSDRQAKNIVKTNKKSMSAPLHQSMFQAKIDEKLYVFWDIDFGWILGGFWEAKIIDFRTFFIIFSMQNLECNLEGQKIEKNWSWNEN